MARTARELLEGTTGKPAPDPHANRLLPLIARGAAQRSTLAALALEQGHVIPADRRAFLHLAERPDTGPDCAAFFTALAEGEALALDRLAAYADACGCGTGAARAAYEPLAGCQSYPAYVAWLAMNGSPAEVVLALTADLAAWGGYCTTIAEGLRHHYGFADEACGFFDLFAEPAPELRRLALAAVREGLETDRLDADRAHRQGRVLQTCETSFWHALWEQDQRVP
ncbi:transcriptional regulator [Streptomyces fagopyri]|uniref:Transcriptional regulator n=1 Tax=Streptomyces fagopyri TaxID=2662397 RepID=A0A5Q0LKY2_9ACTN|nr:transcriptional regulator [Streptomyces fagopyri]QFZ77720.1 transcriptional regulator [Streptomyces fagopyri]